MPAFCVEIDSNHIVTVAADGFDVLRVGVSGVRIDEGPPHLEISAGKHPQDGEGSYLIWEDDLPVEPGQVVTISMLEDARTSRPGSTIEELYPEGPEQVENPKTREELFLEIRSKRSQHESFGFHMETSRGFRFAGNTNANEHGFGFGVLWNSFHPEKARVSLHSYTLDSLEHESPMSYHAHEEMRCGDSVQFGISKG